MKEKYRVLLKRYRFALLALAVNLAALLIVPDIGAASLKSFWDSLLDMMSFMPPVFILIGLLDEWVSRETLMKYMGDDSGVRGMLLSLLMGSVAAGPLYAAFPVCVILMRKGVRMLNMYILIFAWCTTKVHHLLFESANLGVNFMLARLACNIVGMFIIAFIMEKTTPKEEREALYHRAETVFTDDPEKNLYKAE